MFTSLKLFSASSPSNKSNPLSLFYSAQKEAQRKEVLLKQDRPQPFKVNQLTSREQEVIALVAKEFSTKQIATELFISRETVSTHRKNIMRKLNVKNSAGMVRRSFECGYLSI